MPWRPSCAPRRVSWSTPCRDAARRAPRAPPRARASRGSARRRPRRRSRASRCRRRCISPTPPCLRVAPDLDHAALGPGHGAAHEQQVVADVHDLEPALRDALVAHLPWAADALEHAPGARTLCEPCDTGPRWKLWRLIVPAKPLPLEVPDTFTVWPFSNTEPAL